MRLTRADLDVLLMGGQAMTWSPTATGWAGPVGESWVEVAPGPRLVEGSRAAFETHVRREGPAAAGLARDGLVGAHAQALPRLRILRQDPWVATLSFLLSPVNNLPRIRQILRRIAAAAGRAETDRWAVPGPDEVARLGTGGLRRAGAGYRAPHVAASAATIARGDVDLNALVRAPLPDAIAALLPLPGIGTKVAECVCAYGLDIGEAFPIDRHVARAMPAGLDVAAARARWRHRASLAQQVLFESSLRGLRPRPALAESLSAP